METFIWSKEILNQTFLIFFFLRYMDKCDKFISAFVSRILKQFFSALSTQQKIFAEFELSRILKYK